MVGHPIIVSNQFDFLDGDDINRTSEAEYLHPLFMRRAGAGNVRSVRNAIKKLGFSIKDVSLNAFSLYTWQFNIY